MAAIEARDDVRLRQALDAGADPNASRLPSGSWTDPT